MAEAKTIKLLLSNGKLSGLLIAELSKWDGILFSSPRSSFQLLSNERETKFWGVYLLVSEDRVYIGQANELIRRITEHDKVKIWWEKVVLLTTRDNSLNRSDIDYLETKLIQIAKSIGTLETDNNKAGNSPKVTRYRETELNDFLDGGLLLLELIGIKVFSEDINHNIRNQYLIEELIEKNKHIDTTVITTPRMEKRYAISFFKNNYQFDFSSTITNYASMQINKGVYWINPHIDALKNKWILILNNQSAKVLTILEIPENEFTINDNSIENKRLLIRKDRPNYVDLNLRMNDFTDDRSKCDFSKYIKKVINY